MQETAATVDEITHSGAQVTKRATEVIATVQVTAQTVRQGSRAATDAAKAMEAIREQGEAAAGNIVTLSEKTRTIGDIIETVNDISDARKLLGTVGRGVGADCKPAGRLPVTAEAINLLQAFGQKMMDDGRGKSAWYASTLNKAPGQALRLSAVLTFLRWSAEADTDVPTSIDVDRMRDAIDLMDAYFLEQAKRVRQTATVDDAYANAVLAILAILRERGWKDCFTGRQLQRVASGRLADTPNRKAACEILAEASLLFWKPEKKGSTKGREREEYRVNPIIFGIRPAENPEDPPGVRQPPRPPDLHAFCRDCPYCQSAFIQDGLLQTAHPVAPQPPSGLTDRQF